MVAGPEDGGRASVPGAALTGTVEAEADLDATAAQAASAEVRLAILTALASCGVVGAIQGTLVARLRIPSFVVTLAGFLLFRGILVLVLGGADGSVGVNAGVPNQTVIYDLVQGLIIPAASGVIL